MIIHLLFSLSFSFSAIAQDSRCYLHQADFVDSVEGIKKFSLPMAMMDATPKLELVDEKGKMLFTCASSVVSDSGTMMTSGHCVDYCLKLAGDYSKSDDGLSHIDRSRLASTTCHLRVNGGEIVDGHVLAINECRMVEKVKVGSKCNGTDYAILKLDQKKSHGCFKVSDQAVEAGSSVATIGYPIHSYRFAQRKEALDAPQGLSQQFSSGQVLKPKNSCYLRRDKDPREQPFRKDYTSDFAMDRANAGVLLQTDVDQLDGSGGGPLIDLKTGEIRGIMDLDMTSDIFVECQGGSFAVAASAMMADIKANYPALDIETVFGCRTNAVIKSTGSK